MSLHKAIVNSLTLSRSKLPIPRLSIAIAVLMMAACGRQSDPPPKPPQEPLVIQPAPSPIPPAEPSFLRDRTAIVPSTAPVYQLEMQPSDVQQLELQAFSNQTHPASFLAEDILFDSVKIRYRGAFARHWPKKPLKIFFPDSQLFKGQSRINLNSGWRDPAFIREHLAYHIYTACGVPASRTRIIQLHLNDKFRGLYTEVEQPDSRFLKRLGFKGVTLFKASSRANQSDQRDFGSDKAFPAHYEQETQKESGYGSLQQFCRDLARTPNVAEFFATHVDLDKYVSYLAASALIQNWDAFNKNHFIAFDGQSSKKWFIIPWDLDRTLGDHWDGSFDRANLPLLHGSRQYPGVTGWNRMADRFFSDPTLKARYARRLDELLQTEFTPEKLFPIIDQLQRDIADPLQRDRRLWPGPASNFRNGIAELKGYIKDRRAFIQRELPKFLPGR